MDEICNAIITKFCDLGELDNYLILEEQELLDAFPTTAEKSPDALREALNKLRANGFIDIRYERENLFCIAPLKRAEVKDATAPIKGEKGLNKFYFFAVGCFLLGFLGSLLGGIIAGLF